MPRIRAALFDKDGTILDFHRTWDAAIVGAIRAAAPDATTAAHVAHLLDVDLEIGVVRPTSLLIAASSAEVLDLVEPYLDVGCFTDTVTAQSIDAVAPSEGLPELFHRLRAVDVALAVVTNDDEAIARRQLATLGWGDLFDQVVGSDSGFGAKPAPGIVEGALGLLGRECDEAVMIGDTSHDLLAARGAGVATVLVTNGEEPDTGTVALADVVVTSLARLADALTRADLL